MKIKTPELLSPAGSWEALTAAVQNGADAVYMGGTKFNARRQADNFDKNALKRAVEYAHLYGVRVYITLNILLKEKELGEMKEFVKELEELSVDGVIVQDLGAARYVARNHPRLSLHASTQMTIHQAEGAKVLEELGFDRVIPARELTLEELKHLSDNTSLELETFIHGALCVSYSGQCLMSSFIGGRSGNRGMCAQPCRLSYILNKQKGDAGRFSYHLSLKDLSTLEFLDEILKAGVTGLKIEGRMKRAEYVAVVTRKYRKALDSIIKTGSYKPDPAAIKELEQIFNRGSFTKGYYYGTDHKNLYAGEKPSNWGIYLGRVTRWEKGMVWVSLEEDVETGDGVEFWTDDSKGAASDNMGQTINRLIIKGRETDKGRKGQLAAFDTKLTLSPGTRVYRTSSVSQLKKAAEFFQDIYGRKMLITAEAVLHIGERPKLIFRDDKGLEGRSEGDFQVQFAVNKALTRETVEKQLGRLGDTPFELKELELDWDAQVFLPVSVLNQLRRDAAEELMKARIRFYGCRALISERKPGLHEDIINAEPASGQKAVLNGYADRLNYPPAVWEGLDIISFNPSSFSFDLNRLKDQVTSIKDRGISVRLSLPVISRMQDMAHLRSLPDSFWDLFDSFQISNLGQIKLLREKGVEGFYGSYNLNATNSLALEALKTQGLAGVTLSPELTMAEIRDIIKRSCMMCEVLVYGRIPLMTLEYCPHAKNGHSCEHCRFTGEYTLTDRKGYTFPIRKKRIARCYSELLNSQPVFLADDMKSFHDLPLSSWGLKLEGLSQEEAEPVIKSYRYALDNPGAPLPEKFADYAKAVKNKGFTKGHFFRGVK
ncbi:MAG: DUF3656 domain-containing U32 family peptidase [Caldicoprobacterales bacterium]